MQEFLYGGDYNLNQWPKEEWQADIDKLKQAGINSATINVFSWASLQPSEKTYDFEELDEIVSILSDNQIKIVMGTSTAALPAWLFKKYPEVGRTDFYGRKHRFGQRHNACPNSPKYLEFTEKLVNRLAKRYATQEDLVCWHVNNEYGGECYCQHCEKAFQKWLKEKYITLDALNKAWNNSFWGHTIHEWDEIIVPNLLGDALDEDNTAFAGLSLDYRRFMSDSLLNNYKLERDIIRSYDDKTPITTNFMGNYKGLDYAKWAKEIDVISWDSYPAYDTPWSMVAMMNDVMRGLKKRPFMLMEQTPSQQNWQPFNSLKKPGQMRAQSYQTIAHGGDTIQFFQLKRSVGGCEKFHGAVLEHVGHTDTRVFREVAQLGEELSGLSELIGTRNKAEVALVFDWDNYWALEYTSGPHKDLKYTEQIHTYYHYFYEHNIPVDIIFSDDDLSGYKLVVAPTLYLLKDDIASRIDTFVKSGGHFLTTFMSGIVDETDNVILSGYPGPLKDVLGIWVEEIDALAPGQFNSVQLLNGLSGTSQLLSDIIHLRGAKSLGGYTSNFYAGSPVATKNKFGQGTGWYVGTSLDKPLLDQILNQLSEELSLVATVREKTELEVTKRYSDDFCYTFVINLKQEPIKLPSELVCQKDLLSGELLDQDHLLQPFDTLLLKKGLD